MSSTFFSDFKAPQLSTVPDEGGVVKVKEEKPDQLEQDRDNLDEEEAAAADVTADNAGHKEVRQAWHL